MSNGTNKESDLNKVDTLSGGDYVRVVKSGASRNITLDNLSTVLSSTIGRTLDIVTSDVNYLASTGNDVVLMNVFSGDLTLTLPSAATNLGLLLQVKKIDTSNNDVVVQTVSGTIDGSSSVTMSGSGGAKPSASFVSDGSNWYILNA